MHCSSLEIIINVMCQRLPLLLWLIPALASAQQLSCPRYSQSQLSLDQGALNLQREFASPAHKTDRAVTRSAASANFIDDYVFAKMAKDGVESAPPTTDSEFLRRIYLDVTGRIPQPEAVEKFLSDTSP